MPCTVQEFSWRQAGCSTSMEDHHPRDAATNRCPLSLPPYWWHRAGLQLAAQAALAQCKQRSPKPSWPLKWLLTAPMSLPSLEGLVGVIRVLPLGLALGDCFPLALHKMCLSMSSLLELRVSLNRCCLLGNPSRGHQGRCCRLVLSCSQAGDDDRVDVQHCCRHWGRCQPGRLMHARHVGLHLQSPLRVQLGNLDRCARLPEACTVEPVLELGH